jgi:hypothetical protein
MNDLDHRPYLRPGVDLITAEDVAGWLRGPAWHTPPPLAHVSLGYVTRVLDARLDRERRQACRRGALAEWREFRAEAGNVDWISESLDVWGNRRRALRALSRALAFRAAARAK